MSGAMKNAATALVLLLLAGPVLAQRPSDPALLVPQDAPALDYVPAPSAVTLPDGVTMGATAAVAFDASGHLWVLTRGPVAFFEFDQKGAYVRSFGEGLFTRAHGMRIDREGNLWAGDVGAHIVRKFSRDGQVLLTIGTKGEAGEWNEAAGSRKLNQPNDVAIADNGDIFIVQGHTPGSARRRPRAQVRQDRPLPRVVGRQGHGARSVRGGARHRHRRQRAALGRGSREPAHSGVRSERARLCAR